MSTQVKSPSGALLEQELALSAYVEALLAPEPSATPAVERRAAVVSLPRTAPAPVSGSEAPAEGVPQVPAWGEKPFQCLLFNVGGLTLAAPLVMLDGILEWHPERVAAMPNRSPWFLGLLSHRGANVKVIDTWRVVAPERERQQAADPALQRVVLVDERRWGLVCDGISSVITLTPEAVRWRSAATRRRWLAGTAVEQLCAVVDVDELVRLLGSDTLGRREG